MSLHLGAIHKWLYKQIRTIEAREDEIINKFSNKYDNTKIEKLINPIREEYGELKGDTSLKEMIGDSHIHPWLEGAITTAQTREAAVVKELLAEYDDFSLLKEIYQENGQKLAKSVAKDIEEEMKLEKVFELLKDNFLERMPCDRLSTVINDGADRIVWRHDAKLHQEFWQAVGVDISLMHQLYSNWIEGFITQLNAKIDYKREFEVEYYEDILEV